MFYFVFIRSSSDADGTLARWQSGRKVSFYSSPSILHSLTFLSLSDICPSDPLHPFDPFTFYLVPTPHPHSTLIYLHLSDSLFTQVNHLGYPHPILHPIRHLDSQLERFIPYSMGSADDSCYHFDRWHDLLPGIT
jgi:hypothetical protein